MDIRIRSNCFADVNCELDILGGIVGGIVTRHLWVSVC